LQAQTTYQAPHVAILWVVEFSLQTKEGLQAQTTYQAPHVIEVRATESSIQVEKWLQTQITYQAPHVAEMWALNFPSKQRKGYKLKQLIKLPM
jgi:hypothetical protein